jgi:hypothetical protein
VRIRGHDGERFMHPGKGEEKIRVWTVKARTKN